MDIKVLIVCFVFSASVQGQISISPDTGSTKINSIDTVVLAQYNDYFMYEIETGDTVIVTNFQNDSLTGRSIIYLQGNMFVNYHTLTTSGITTDTICGYYPNGKLRFHLFPTKVNDYLLFGEWYYPNGILQKKRKVVGDTVITKQWFQDGILKSVFREIAIDPFLLVIKGKQETYYPDGKIKSLEVISDGIQPIVSYWPNGNVQQIGTIVNNPLSWIGVKKEYFENGQIERIYRYLEGSTTETANIAHGWWEYYDAQGKFIKAQKFRNGRLIETITNMDEFKKRRKE